MSTASRALLLVWELPQNLLGLFNVAINVSRRRIERVHFDRERVMVEVRRGANQISLGLFVFWSSHDNPFVPVGAENRDHEYGRSVQSRWLGPLYLPLVGVPSTLRVVYAVAHRTITGRRWGGYYDGWPERSADVLGRVDRSLRPAP
jgi:hypothetical protein